MTIAGLSAREILDSRGRPTVSARCALSGGATATASVPSGRSTGSAEALELRDGDASRYGGLGCLKAAANVSGEIARAVVGREFASQAELDRFLCGLDGTPNKSRLGANALLSVSLAAARAAAREAGLPLYRYFAWLSAAGEPQALPRLTINLFSGGRHAGRQVAIQDVLAVPLRPTSIDASLVMMYDVYQRAAAIMLERWGMRLLTADEGGLAPPFDGTDAMLETAVEAIRSAGYEPGADVALAVDCASTHFFTGGRYRLDGRSLSSAQMIDTVEAWLDRFPIVSVEDGLAEDDWEAWSRLTERIGERVLVLGDDLLCTDRRRIGRAVSESACNALLLKVNQVGTLTEAAESLSAARRAGWQVTVSVRSGETEDDWAADLAVGFGGDQFKNGSITQSERLAKYNRLLEIEGDTGLPVRRWAAPHQTRR